MDGNIPEEEWVYHLGYEEYDYIKGMMEKR